MRNTVIVSIICIAVAVAQEDYVVATTAEKKDAYWKVVEEMANFRKAAVLRFAPAELDKLKAELQKAKPRYVAVVMPREQIDVKFARAFLLMATEIDDDPFVDFSYGFITGTDAEKALAFVKNIEKAEKAKRMNSVFSSWVSGGKKSWTDEDKLQIGISRTTVQFAGDDGDIDKFRKDSLPKLSGHDLMLFTGHGGTEGISESYSYSDLQNVNLFPAVVVSCACYTGTVHKCYWIEEGELKPYVSKPEESFALAVLNSGAIGYFAGLDGWHGIPAGQAFNSMLYDGLECGEAARRLYDRMVLAWEESKFDRKKLQNMLEDEKNPRLVVQPNMVFFGDPAFRVYPERVSDKKVKVSKPTDGNVELTVTQKLHGNETWYSFVDYYRAGDSYGNEFAFSAEIPAAGIDSIKVKDSSVAELKEGKPFWRIESRDGKYFLHASIPFKPDNEDFGESDGAKTFSMTLEITSRH